MGTLPVGTFKYKMFKYPGDIDIFEKLEQCCTFNVAKLSAAQKIQSIIRDIDANKDVLFTEFKAGYDSRYKIYTGVIDGNIEDYNAALIRRDLMNIFEAGLLTEEEHYKLSGKVKEIPDIHDIISLNEELRNYWVVRWSVPEILRGYKLLRGNYKLYLDDAITHGSIVKLDTVAYLDNRYVEVTNFFLISSLDKTGRRVVLSEELTDYGQSLLADVYKYYDINPLKSIKRLWMYLAFKGKLCELAIFKPLFSSNVALYSQILSDVDVAITLLAPNPYMSGHFDHKLLFKSLDDRLRLLNGLCIDEPLYYDVESNDFTVVVANLKILKQCLQDKVNAMTYEWLQSHNIDFDTLLR